MLRSLHVLFLLSLAVSSFGQTPNSDDPLKQTQELLRNPTLRDKALDTPAAQDSQAKLKNLTNGDSKLEQEIWEMAADLMPVLEKASDGNPEKMQTLLDEAKSNPESFANRFPASQRKKLKEIAEKIANKQSKKP